MRARLDTELVRLGHAPTRGRAVELINAGAVNVDGVVSLRPGLDVSGRTVTMSALSEHTARPVSRGGHKLAGVFAQLPELTVRDRRCLDAGASTGGFTEVLLDRGAAEVVAVDVGHDQLVDTLRADPRVRVHEGLNVRELTPDSIGGPADFTTADLSFISLTLVLPALLACTRSGGDLVVLVKPQFEVGRARLGHRGVVRDPGDRVDAVEGVLGCASSLGLTPRAVTRSVLPGPAGNVEFFVWLHNAALHTDAMSTSPVGVSRSDLQHLAEDPQAVAVRID